MLGSKFQYLAVGTIVPTVLQLTETLIIPNFSHLAMDCFRLERRTHCSCENLPCEILIFFIIWLRLHQKIYRTVMMSLSSVDLLPGGAKSCLLR